MSGANTHGVGAALWASADVASAVNATAAKNIFIENLVIVHLQQLIRKLAYPMAASQSLEQTTNAIRPSIWRDWVRDFVISRFSLRGYLAVSVRSPSCDIRPWGDRDEPRFEGLLFYRIGFDPGARACG
jgi:hypothetical protein